MQRKQLFQRIVHNVVVYVGIVFGGRIAVIAGCAPAHICNSPENGVASIVVRAQYGIFAGGQRPGDAPLPFPGIYTIPVLGRYTAVGAGETDLPVAAGRIIPVSPTICGSGRYGAVYLTGPDMELQQVVLLGGGGTAQLGRNITSIGLSSPNP